MEGYLGECDVSHEHGMSPHDTALLFISMYGGIGGDHHKDWVLDQVARILNGAPIVVKEAAWSNGHTELRYTVGTCDKYDEWVAGVKSDGDDTEAWGYELGSAP